MNLIANQNMGQNGFIFKDKILGNNPAHNSTGFLWFKMFLWQWDG